MIHELIATTGTLLRRGSLVAAIATTLLVGAMAAPAIVLSFVRVPQILYAVVFFAGFFMIMPFALAAPFTAFAATDRGVPRLLATLKDTIANAPSLLPATLCALVPATFIPMGIWYGFRVLSGEQIRGEEGRAAPFLPLVALAGMAVWTRYVALPAAAIAVDRVDWREAGVRAQHLCRAHPLFLGAATNAPLLILLAVIPTGPSQDAIHAILNVQLVAIARTLVALAALLGALLASGALSVASYRIASRDMFVR